MKRISLLATLVILIAGATGRAAKIEWPGLLGKICFDTPQPKKVSGADYKMAYEGSKTEDQRKNSIENLKNRELIFDGELVVQVNNGIEIPLPKEKGILMSNLDPKSKHSIKIKNTRGKIYQSFKVTFDKPDDPRLRISQGSFYHIQMMTMPPPKKCPWELVE